MSTDTCSQSSCLERLLAAALEVFRESGYRGSIDAVAKRAGVARQTIYNHFESKDALFLAALDQAVGEVFAPLESEEGDCQSRLMQFSLRFRSRVLSPEAINLHRVLVAEAPRFPALAQEFYQRVIINSRQRLARMIEAGMQEGCLRKDDPMEAASLYLDILAAPEHESLLFMSGTINPADEEKKVQRVMELFGRLYVNPDSPCALEHAAQEQKTERI